MAVGDYISEILTSDGSTHPIGSSVWVSSGVWNGKTKTEVENEIKTKFSNLTEITWSSLKSLVSTGTLIPGMKYRITDYKCTTTQDYTRSAGHQFDIIVEALDENTLSENASVINHSVSNGETDYFADCDLNAWNIWYCLDNDKTRFAWADDTKTNNKENGRGVIYRMIDEFGNDCPYDFKNIQFYRQWDETKLLWSTISSNNTGVPCYTFSSNGNSSTTSFTDMSLTSSNNVYSNVIVKYVNSNKQTLNNICFFGNNCYSNTFGNNCYKNTFRVGCTHNTFGNDCYYNTFGNSCYKNTFGNYCYSNTFGNDCYSNTFGNKCYSNTFGNNILESQFGDGVQYFSITTQQMTTEPASSYVKNYIRWLIVENGVRYVNAYVTGTTSYTSYCQNVRICLGVQGVNSNNRKTFDITSCINSKLNNVYQPANAQTTSV